MNRLSSSLAWAVVKERLKKRFDHLTDDDFARMELAEEEMLERLLRRAGNPRFEMAHLVEETLEHQVPMTTWPLGFSSAIKPVADGCR
jgi:hypothetical protein